MANKRLTPIKAIRAYCVECSAGSVHQVRECHLDDCPLYPYRMGKNPARAGQKGNTDNLKKYRDSLNS